MPVKIGLFFWYKHILNRGDKIKTYTVKQGDTLYGISNQYGVSVTDIMNLNNLKSNTLQIGQVLKIPESSGVNAENTFRYEVKKGDSLYSIAKKYSTTVSSIIDTNNLKTNTLQIGQILNIPSQNNTTITIDKPQYINYTVKQGDTLYKIANTYNIDIETLKKDNGLITNTINPGQIIQIRDTNNYTEVEECFGEDYIEPTSKIYLVQKGDSLYKIAKEFNVTVNEIIEANNLKTTTLSINQELIIPLSNNDITYTIQKGDSLYSIAKKYNTTVDEIKSKNNLTSNNLSIGQKLLI